jgi:hypothetical protein
LKITIESTKRVVKFHARRGAAPVDCRVWEGKTESGIEIQCLIPMIAVREEARQQEFEAELKTHRGPQIEPQAFPARLIV